MGKQLDMIDSLYEKESRELAIAKNIQRGYKNLEYIKGIIYATSLRFKSNGTAFSTNKKLANAVEMIHYAIFHLCTFIYYETRELKEYEGVTPMSLIDDVEEHVSFGNTPGKPLDEIMRLWKDSTFLCTVGLNLAVKNLQNDKSIQAYNDFRKASQWISRELEEAYLLNEIKYALQGRSK
jgi:hypothetical protein